MTYDFGYMWPITRGHFLVFLLFGAVAAVCAWRGWPRWITALTSVVAAWGLAGALVMHYAIQINAPMTMPTDRSWPRAAATWSIWAPAPGRATLMVLMARPRTTVTGLDRYTGYYGIDDNSPDRLRANARLAGVEDRLRVQVGDMRELPFKDGEFDGALSVAAMDHLRAQRHPARAGRDGAHPQAGRRVPVRHHQLRLLGEAGVPDGAARPRLLGLEGRTRRCGASG